MIPSSFIRAPSVVGFRPSKDAAPPSRVERAEDLLPFTGSEGLNRTVRWRCGAIGGGGLCLRKPLARLQGRARTHDDGAFDDVLELPHVSGPGAGAESIQNRRGDRVDLLAEFGA